MLRGWFKTVLFAVFLPFAAQAWEPNGDINIIVAYKEGTGTDTGARLLAKQLSDYTGTKINIINIPGSEGVLGWSTLISAYPNGQTIGYISMPTFTTFCASNAAPFSTKDIVPIANHLSEVSVIAVKSSSEFNTIEDLVDAMKNSGKLRASTNGEKASNHTAAQIFAKSAGVSYVPVHYDSTADQIIALRMYEADFTCVKLSDVIRLARGKNPELRIIAVFSETRDPFIPHVPTLAEKGLYPHWYGSARAIVAPAGTPKEAIDFYVDAIEKTLTNPKNFADHSKLGLVIDYMNNTELQELIDVQVQLAQEYLNSLY